MGSSILRGITTALLVTVLTLFAGIAWSVMGFGVVSISQLLDIGLLASCLIGGYRAAKESGEWLLGGIVGASYVTVGTLLLTLFLPVQGWGFIQVLAEGAIIGLVAGAIGAGGAKGIGMSAWSAKRSQFTPSYAGYETNDGFSCKSDWGKEEDPQEWKKATRNHWIESSESDIKETRRAKKDCEKSMDVQWSWDREEEKLIDSGPENLESKYIEPEQLEQGQLEPRQLERVRISTSANKASGAGPWWEQ